MVIASVLVATSVLSANTDSPWLGEQGCDGHNETIRKVHSKS